MSAITQEPIFEDVCTATERRIIGWRDADGVEQLIEEGFSSGVPAVIGGTLDTAALSFPPGYVPGYTTPGFIPGGGPLPDPATVPIPGAAFLLVGALILVYVVQQVKRSMKQ